MEAIKTLTAGIVANWPVWVVTITLVVAAVIDGRKLKVPNWITFPLVIGGWLFSAIFCGLSGLGFWSGLGCSLLGTAVGLGLLLPAYAIGGMGAGDVKLLPLFQFRAGQFLDFTADTMRLILAGDGHING